MNKKKKEIEWYFEINVCLFIKKIVKQAIVKMSEVPNKSIPHLSTHI